MDWKPAWKYLAKNYHVIILVMLFSTSLYIRLVGFRFPYLRNIDSYVFYRYMNYTIETGKIPDYDPLMLAPTGANLTMWNMFYVFLGAKTYEAVRLFFDIPLWRFLVYFPAVLASLMVMPAYVIGKELYDRDAGLLAAFMLVFSPVVMSRTLGGDPDSDAIVLLMSLATVASLTLVIKRKKILDSVVAGIVFSLFAWTWVGFWYVYWLYLGTVLVLFAIKRDWADIRNLAIVTAVFLAATYLLTGRFLGGYVLRAPFGTIGLFGTGGIKSEEGQFPNVYVSVAEMQSNSLSSLMRQIGGYLLVPSIIGLAYLAYSYVKTRRHLEALVLLGLWAAGFFYASLTAVRFSIFLIIPLSFLTAIAFSKALKIALGEEYDR